MQDGDIVVVTSKVVAKAEGLLTADSREAVIDRETDRIVATRAGTRIVRHRLGLVLAAAGVDASNVDPGLVLPLPRDPDRSARQLRAVLLTRLRCNVGILVTDTAGRPWRQGQTDLVIGAAGVRLIDDHTGVEDGYGNLLAVTAPAVGDEIAGAAELVRTKVGRRPFAVVRGRSDLVLPSGEDGLGLPSLIRSPSEDLFGFGAREAVLRALLGRAEDQPVFGAPGTLREVLAAINQLADVTAHQVDETIEATGSAVAITAIAFAHGWLTASVEDGTSDGPFPKLTLSPRRASGAHEL